MTLTHDDNPGRTSMLRPAPAVSVDLSKTTDGTAADAAPGDGAPAGASADAGEPVTVSPRRAARAARAARRARSAHRTGPPEHRTSRIGRGLARLQGGLARLKGGLARLKGGLARHAPSGGHPNLRRPRWTMLGWRLFVAGSGALVLVVCSGMALGIVTVSGHGLGLDLNTAGDVPPATRALAGADGIYPGGPGRDLPVTVDNTGPSSFEVTAVRPDLTALPERCPQSAWRVSGIGALPTVAPHSRATLALPLALLPQAPDGCQGLTLTFPVRIEALQRTGTGTGPDDGKPAGTTSTVTVSTAVLGSPGAGLGVRGDEITVTPTPPAHGPRPTGYAVSVLGAGGDRSPVCPAGPGGGVEACVDHGVPAAVRRNYLVTARLGEHWVRDSTPAEGWSPPPAPVLTFAAGRPAASALRLVAPAASGAYDVALFADGGTAPFVGLRVGSGSGLDRVVKTPGFGPGSHRIVAVATFHGWRVPSATVRLSISAQGVATPASPEPPAPITPPVSVPVRPQPPAGGPPSAPAGPQQPTLSHPPAATDRAPAATSPAVAAPTAPPEPVIPSYPDGVAPAPGVAPPQPVAPQAAVGPGTAGP